MRNVFRDAMVKCAKCNPKAVFLSGDLGFNALEPVVEAFGARFINAGVAEQNMIGVAAGMARAGMEPWTYSIAPFSVLRPFEQIRNDVCYHNLPVKIVGNGGGFGYGVMGPTHHALEDYSCLSTLPNMRCYVPAFDQDVPELVNVLHRARFPTYLRLGFDRKPCDQVTPTYAPWRYIKPGKPGGVLFAAIGPIAGLLWSWCLEKAQDAAIWVASELPLPVAPPSSHFLNAVEDASALITVEEHVRTGGFGEQLVSWIAEADMPPKKVRIMAARRERESVYGDQLFCLENNGLGQKDLLSVIREFT